ncbi:hypothetical protein NW767_015554 [Fusarium falciforme]|nr:hypothetical protein NW767_015554 [Fusarium falciforme]
MAVSVGSGLSKERVADDNEIYAHVCHGWLRRLTDNYEKKLDPELQWAEFRGGIDEEQQWRYHRLNVELSGVLPTLYDTDRIEDMDEQTKKYFGATIAGEKLSMLARHAISALFYPVLTIVSRVSEGRFHVKGQILCRLAPEYQLRLVDGLRSTGSGNKGRQFFQTANLLGGLKLGSRSPHLSELR